MNRFASIVAGLSLAFVGTSTTIAGTDGTPIAWGFNQQGQCNVPAGETFIQVDAGDYHSLGLRADGTAIGWGYNQDGQASVPENETFIQVAAGSYYSIGLRADGTPVVWGQDTYCPVIGACCFGGGSYCEGDYPQDYCEMDGGTFVSSCADCTDGDVACCVDDFCVVISAFDCYSVSGTVVDSCNGSVCTTNVACCVDGFCIEFSVALCNAVSGTIVASCDGSVCVDQEDETDSGSIYDVPAGETFTRVSAGNSYAIGLRSDGTAIAWGCDSYGYGVKSIPPGETFIQVEASIYCSLGLRPDGTVIAWGLESHPIMNVPTDEIFVQIALGTEHAVGLRADGTAIAWGQNSQGQCNVPAGATFTQISTSFYHNVGILSDGSAVAWGYNQYGQCNVPPIISCTSILKVAAGGNHSIILNEVDSDGDGTPDLCDGCPDDVNKIEPGFCDCGTADTNVNGDVDCDGDYDVDDIYAGMANFNITTGTPGDVNADGSIDTSDLDELRTSLDLCASDTDMDGDTDIEDLLNVIGSWGSTCTP